MDTPKEMDMRSRTRFHFALASTLVAALMTGGCGGGSTSEELVIGEYGSLTNIDADFGQSTKHGIELALDQLTAQSQGQIGGLKVRLVVEDDQGKPEEAATVVQKLINQDRVITVLGEVASSRSLAAGPICQSAGVPMISPSSTNAKVTQVGDYIFRMCFIDPFQGTVMAKFAADSLKLKRVAILKDVKNDYSVGLAEFFGAAFQRLGGQILGPDQAYSSGDQDFRPQLTTLKARKPEAIYVPGYYTEVGLIARQARELGLKVPILGGDGWESDQLLQIGGEALEGCYYSNHFATDNPDPRLQDFLRKFHAKFGADPNAMAGLGYDAANVLFGALGRLHEQDPEEFKALSSSKAGTAARKTAEKKLRDLIATTTNFPGVTGTITLDENRNASKPAVVLEIKGGKKVYSTTINP
jgi:branched-chain amino acid transport system substrate-binding protein